MTVNDSSLFDVQRSPGLNLGFQTCHLLRIQPRQCSQAILNGLLLQRPQLFQLGRISGNDKLANGQTCYPVLVCECFGLFETLHT